MPIRPIRRRAHRMPEVHAPVPGEALQMQEGGTMLKTSELYDSLKSVDSVLARRDRFLTQVVEHFSKNPSQRAESGGICRLLTSDGRRCAVGLLFDDVSLCNKGMSSEASDMAKELLCEGGHPGDLGPFSRSVQMLHDHADNWHTSGGLTERGRAVLEVCRELAQVVPVVGHPSRGW